MSTTSKSPRKVLRVAYHVGKQTLRNYPHRFSPKKFTQPQLFACLILKEFLRMDYRKLEALLIDTPTLCDAIGMSRVPHFTTFQKAAKRLLVRGRARRLLAQTVTLGIDAKLVKKRTRLVAADGTGFESHHISRYFVRRRERGQNTGKTRGNPLYQTTTYTRFPKAGVVCDCGSHMILAVVPERGPGPDIKHTRRLLTGIPESIRITTVLADAGYDGEWVHEFVRNELGSRTIIPATIGRPTSKPPNGRWRRVMKQRFERMKKKYGQRWQIETVNSMWKRLLGSAMRARCYWSQCREITLRAITLNIMILRRGHGAFLQSSSKTNSESASKIKRHVVPLVWCLVVLAIQGLGIRHA